MNSDLRYNIKMTYKQASKFDNGIGCKSSLICKLMGSVSKHTIVREIAADFAITRYAHLYTKGN